jgi:tetratricopeptide (TPR) repeat protein
MFPPAFGPAGVNFMDYRLEQLRFELREDPSSRIFFELGEHLRREGELGEAIEVLRTGIKEHPRYVAAWVSLGRAQLDNGDAEGSREALERALQLDPENAVAARAMGEAAIKTSDWVTAVKALKRARGLSPQDDELDERIEFVEARLAELGLLKQPPPNGVAEAAARVENPPIEESVEEPVEATVEEPVEEHEEEPFEVRSAGETGEWDDSDDVFAAGQVADDPSLETPAEDAGEDEPTAETPDVNEVDSGAFADPPPLTDDDVSSIVDGDDPVVSEEPAVVVHDEEPFEDESSGAQGAEFVAPEPEPMVEPEPEPEFEPLPEPKPEPEPEQPPVSEPVAEVEPEPLPESWPDPEPEVEPELEKDSNGLPLPTMTLARLAIDQGDLDLAERTLRGVLEREPGHSEAAELLETVVAGPPQADAGTSSSDPSDARAEALQRWLDAVRLASERLKT